jgi:hypothetical protein
VIYNKPKGEYLMIGIIPGTYRTFEVEGDLTSPELKEGKLYYDSKDGRLYYYSSTETRSNPANGFFPIWNGSSKYISNFSIEKYVDKDVTKLDLSSMSSSLDKATADKITYDRKRADCGDILNPIITDEDNMFTQCVKGTISAKQLTMIDLVETCGGSISQQSIESYYQALNKIAFMRLEKWYIWVDKILHVGYHIDILKDNNIILGYTYPKNKFQMVPTSCRNILLSDDDPFKKIIKILMAKENIDKSELRSDDIDDYTINNMMTTLNTKKSLSAHLFSRFIQLAGLSYVIKIYDKGKEIFEYKE